MIDAKVANFLIKQASWTSDVRRYLNQVYDAFLSLNVRLYVALGRAQRSMSSQHLNVSERPSDSGNRSRGIGARACPYETL
jgi:hypothetical protein